MIPFLIGLGIVLLLVILILPQAIRIVREYQRLIVFRLGRNIGVKGPGFVLLIPIVDRAVWVDLREQYLEIPHQTAITEDNASISIDFIVFNKVVDPQQSVLSVGNFAGAAQNIAATTLRSVVGDMPLDDVLAKREQMNEILRVKLDEVTERWGVKVTNVEIREIIPPPTVLEAMTRQMSAERTRRAVVLEAEGSKQAAITVAEGNKQSAILNAEGDRQAATPRRRSPIGGLSSRGLRPGPDEDLRGSPGGRREDDEPAVSRCAEADRGLAVDQVHHPHGVLQHALGHRRPHRPGLPGRGRGAKREALAQAPPSRRRRPRSGTARAGAVYQR